MSAKPKQKKTEDMLLRIIRVAEILAKGETTSSAQEKRHAPEQKTQKRYFDIS